MKKILFPSLVVGSLLLFSFDNKLSVKVLPTFSDSQVEQAEKIVLARFGEKVDIQVLKRTRKKGITNIKVQRYSANGSQGGGCASDNFGLLEIVPNGCRISDRGHENDSIGL